MTEYLILSFPFSSSVYKDIGFGTGGTENDTIWDCGDSSFEWSIVIFVEVNFKHKSVETPQEWKENTGNVLKHTCEIAKENPKVTSQVFEIILKTKALWMEFPGTSKMY